MDMADFISLAAKLKQGPGVVQNRPSSRLEVLGCARLQHMELVDSEAQLVQINIEIHKNVWRQRRGEHFCETTGGNFW